MKWIIIYYDGNQNHARQVSDETGSMLPHRAYRALRILKEFSGEDVEDYDIVAVVRARDEPKDDIVVLYNGNIVGTTALPKEPTSAA